MFSLTLQLIKLWEILVIHSKSALLILFACQNASDWFVPGIWKLSCGKLPFLAQVSSPMRHLTSERRAGGSVPEVGSGGHSELTCPARHWDRLAACFYQQKKELGLKSHPAQPADSANLAFFCHSCTLVAKTKNKPKFLGEGSFWSGLIFPVRFLPFIIYWALWACSAMHNT